MLWNMSSSFSSRCVFQQRVYFTLSSDTHQTTFAVSAALLVKQYSTYAKHSGIPEIKTVLGGFVMKRFLGGWTLTTKSIGLVCLPHSTFAVTDDTSALPSPQVSGSAKKDLWFMWRAAVPTSS